MLKCDVCGKSQERMIILKGSIYIASGPADPEKYILINFSDMWMLCSKEHFDELVFNTALTDLQFPENA